MIHKLLPVYKDYIWGGNLLKKKYGRVSDMDIMAESWELSCHPDGPSVLESNGIAFPQYIQENPQVLGKACEKFDEFPILIKFIDAQNALSIQVHPDDIYAKKYENQLGKTEMWYVVEATPEAYLYYGFREEVSKEVFKRAIEDDTICDLLNRVPVKAGDIFFIEAGTIHAIGAGVMIAEIQQSSNVTYRVYDYGRTDAAGNPRELHVDKACDVTVCKPARGDYDFGKHIGSCDYFTVDKVVVEGSETLATMEDTFQALLFLEGTARICSAGTTIDIKAGDCIFVEAGNEPCEIVGDCELLVTYIL